jgi:hypothetical protein
MDAFFHLIIFFLYIVYIAKVTKIIYSNNYILRIYARYYFKCLTSINSFNPPNSSLK